LEIFSLEHLEITFSLEQHPRHLEQDSRIHQRLNQRLNNPKTLDFSFGDYGCYYYYWLCYHCPRQFQHDMQEPLLEFLTSYNHQLSIF
jgi:hypothetical protein